MNGAEAMDGDAATNVDVAMDGNADMMEILPLVEKLPWVKLP